MAIKLNNALTEKIIQKDEKEWQDVNFQNIYVTYLIRWNSKPIYNNQMYQTI